MIKPLTKTIQTHKNVVKPLQIYKKVKKQKTKTANNKLQKQITQIIKLLHNQQK